jgi:hypothetical protein
MATHDDNRDHADSSPTNANTVDADDLSAELAEAKRIGRWLYDRSPALRHFLGDAREWPWLLEPNAPRELVPRTLAEADRDWTVLRAFAVIQASGDDPFDAEDVASTLGLTAEEFDGTLYRLVHARLVTGGQLFSRSFVETVTVEGMAAAGLLDPAGRPLPVLRTDLAGFTAAGYGIVRVHDGVLLEPGQTVILTDEEPALSKPRCSQLPTARRKFEFVGEGW